MNASNPNYASVDGVLYNSAKTTLIQCPGGRSGTFTIPDSIVVIWDDAFNGCTSLISINVPGSVTIMGGNAFFDCTSLTAINVNASNPNYASVDGVLYNSAKTTLIQCPGGIKGSFTVPEGVITIWDYAFGACIFLTSVIMPNSVTSIGNYAFKESISMTSVSIGSNVSIIDAGAFESCISLTTITIPSSVTSFGLQVFDDCTSLTAINVNASNPNYASVDGVLYNSAKTTLIQCPGGIKGSFAIPDGVTTIGYGAFETCTSLTSVTISNNVSTIGFAAFSYCNALTSITFLELIAPTNVGANWMQNTGPGIMGHAYIASNFPTSSNDFFGLTMGSVVPVVSDAPLKFAAKSGNDQAMLSWTAPLNDGGGAIDYYVIYQNGFQVMTINSTSINITGLTNGQDYSFQVAAHNSAGIGIKTPITSIMPTSSSNSSTGTIGNNIFVLPFIFGIVALLVVMALIGALFMRRRRRIIDHSDMIPTSPREQPQQSGQKRTSMRKRQPAMTNDPIHSSGPTPVICPKCGFMSTDGDFCGNCGSKVK